jgi:hypothetical protein
MLQSWEEQGRAKAKLSLWELFGRTFCALSGISVPTSYPADHKGFRRRVDDLTSADAKDERQPGERLPRGDRFALR